jgi:signal transduction histidine kinase
MQENPVSTDASGESGPALASQFTRGGLLGIWWAQPLPNDLIDATALLAARLVLVCVLVGYLAIHLVGASTLSILFTYHLPVVAFVAALSLKQLAIPGRVRVLLTAAGIIIIGLVQYRLQNNPLFTLFVLTPMTTLVLVAYGGRAALSILVAFVLVMVAIELAKENASGINLAIYFLSGFLWALIVAAFTAVLLERIRWDQSNISQDLSDQRETLRVIGDQLKVPAATLALLTDNSSSEVDATAIRDAVQQLLRTYDTFAGELADGVDRPATVEEVDLALLVRQVAVQMAPQLEQRALEFFSDTSLLPALMVTCDRFRLRTILVNLIRTAAALSDGHRLWLQVQAEASGQADGFQEVVFSIEDNGHLPEGSLLQFEKGISDTTSLDGVWLAKTWTEEMGGVFKVFKSPRGGHAFRVTLPLEVVAESDPATQGVGES